MSGLIDELLAIVEQATPGSWRFQPGPYDEIWSDDRATYEQIGKTSIGVGDPIEIAWLTHGRPNHENDARYIATFHPERMKAILLALKAAEAVCADRSIGSGMFYRPGAALDPLRTALAAVKEVKP